MKDSDDFILGAYAIIIGALIVVGVVVLILRLNHWWPIFLMLFIPSLKRTKSKDSDDDS